MAQKPADWKARRVQPGGVINVGAFQELHEACPPPCQARQVLTPMSVKIRPQRVVANTDPAIQHDQIDAEQCDEYRANS